MCIQTCVKQFLALFCFVVVEYLDMPVFTQQTVITAQPTTTGIQIAWVIVI